MKLSKEEYKLIKEFNEKLIKKLEKSRKIYGSTLNHLTKERIKKEIEEEIIDIAGWSIMYWIKLKRENKI